ncbi:Protein CBG25261 [Caenorhabditis briggsae]|uniref:Protein CBG25261 n=1 Tax=Caenorhabditis briggsae TaxID=6238 RepID=B6IFN1_CAEBR|nr:Protein CBG25261 [Caenorhabditis briggsae]CAR98711.1 Protein CBG25261 [Caenorhabditis briggsae]
MGSRHRLDHSDAFDQHSDSTTPKILLLSPEQLMFDYTNGIFLSGMFDKVSISKIWKKKPEEALQLG